MKKQEDYRGDLDNIFGQLLKSIFKIYLSSASIIEL